MNSCVIMHYVGLKKLKVRNAYLTLFIACFLEVKADSSQVVREIGHRYCPYTKFCQRNVTEYYNPIFRQPCCSECSCEENCWEIANCCPDKVDINIHNPVTKCIPDIVKKADDFGKEKWGYHIINYCPVSEKNASLVEKCTTKDANTFKELIWVSDNTSRTIYRNRYCAECHHVLSNLTEWSLEAKCTNEVYNSFGSLGSFFLSGNCQLTVKLPKNLNVTQCMVAKYTTCNQTGLWQTFDTDVEWACQAFEAVFTAKATDRKGSSTYEAYRNPYCYVCNTNGVGNTNTLCPLPSYDSFDVSIFTSIIDFKRYQETDREDSTQAKCKIYEMFDKVMHKCRELKCPFGSSPVYGMCKSLFDGTSGLYVSIPFALDVLWSRSEYKLTDTRTKLRLLGELIMGQVINEETLRRNGSVCHYCYLELIMTADIKNQSMKITHSVSNVTVNNEEKFIVDKEQDSNGPQLILKAVIFTLAECQLQNIFDFASDLFGKVINITVDDNTEMQLRVGLLKENLPENQTIKIIKKMKNKVWDCKIKGAHTVKDDKLCPIFSITYNEFSPHLTNDNKDIIASLFQEKNTETSDPIDVCVNNYYERLQSIDFQIVSEGSCVGGIRAYILFISIHGLLRSIDSY